MKCILQGQEEAKAVPNGLATLNEEGKLTESQRPSLEEINAADREFSNISNAALALANVGAKSGENILINADFRKPVNRNGKTKYTVSSLEPTIDRWKLTNGGSITIVSGGVLIEASENSQYQNIMQQTIDQNLVLTLAGKTVTLSALFSEVNGEVGVRLNDIGGSNKISNAGLVTNTFVFPTASFSNYFSIETSSSTMYTFSGVLVAAKLELGDQQTLAHQDVNGNWILNDESNYPLQYSLCSLYNSLSDEWVGDQRSNLNLLHNWYLIKPINQKGSTEYGYGYGIDRWCNYGGNGKITLEDDCISIYRDSTISGSWYNFVQITEVELSEYVGRTITFSALVKETGGFRLLIAHDGLSALSVSPDIPSGFTGLYSLTYTIPSNASGKLSAVIFTSVENIATKLKAVKLEFDGQSTLAHLDADGNWVLNDPPPDPALELAKCQRYQLVLSALDTYTSVGTGLIDAVPQAQIVVPTPVPLRIKPTISYSGNWQLQICSSGLTNVGVSNISIDKYGVNSVRLLAQANSLVAGAPCILRANNDTSAKIILDSNL